MSRTFHFPPPLVPGDRVDVVAPSSPFGRREFFTGLAWLRERYRVRVASSVLSRSGYLAGDDARRAGELARAFLDPEVKAVLCARGGYGVTRILRALPWEAFARSPKWIVGFSDVTALHLEATALGVASVHGPHVTGLGLDAVDPRGRLAFLRALEGGPIAPWEGLDAIVAGEARGPVAGGNLALVEAQAAAGRLRVPEGAVLALEDVTERPYRIDRMLTSLREGGHLARAAAVVFGGFERCDPGPDGVVVADVVAERTRDLGVPVYAGAPFGHGAPNRAFVLGATATVGGGRVTFAR